MQVRKETSKVSISFVTPICLSVCPQVSQWLSLPGFCKICFLRQSGNSQIFTEFFLLYHVRYTWHFCMLCQIGPFHKLLTNFFRFHWSFIFEYVPSSSKLSLYFGLQLLKPLSIYALHRVFRTPRPFSSPVFHQPNIVCSAAHITKLPALQLLLTSSPTPS